jgi:hypothetical protein
MEHTSKISLRRVYTLIFYSTLLLNYSCVPSLESNDPASSLSNNSADIPADPNINYPIYSGQFGQYKEDIISIAMNSSCANYSWANRGRAPAAYIKGMGLTFARSFCRLKKAELLPNSLASLIGRTAGNPSTDALAHYAINFATAGSEPLRALYTLGIGLGMRESSGKYCEGRDLSASNLTASSAEAGLFQTSYDSISASSELSKLYAEYKANPKNCYLEIFKTGISCAANNIVGSGAGAEYQAFNKSCPAFATEYAMIMLRVRRNHYGPINRKEAEVVVVCNQMLKKIENVIENDPNACDDLL